MKTTNKLIIFALAITVISLSGCLTVSEITPSLSSQTPFTVATNEVVKFTAFVGGSPLEGATFKVSYVDPNSLINVNDAYAATMTTIGITNSVGEVSYTIPTGYIGKRLIYYVEKPSSFNTPGVGIAMVT